MQTCSKEDPFRGKVLGTNHFPLKPESICTNTQEQILRNPWK